MKGMKIDRKACKEKERQADKQTKNRGHEMTNRIMQSRITDRKKKRHSHIQTARKTVVKK